MRINQILEKLILPKAWKHIISYLWRITSLQRLTFLGRHLHYRFLSLKVNYIQIYCLFQLKKFLILLLYLPFRVFLLFYFYSLLFFLIRFFTLFTAVAAAEATIFIIALTNEVAISMIALTNEIIIVSIIIAGIKVNFTFANEIVINVVISTCL